jgi:hypothetical protein
MRGSVPAIGLTVVVIAAAPASAQQRTPAKLVWGVGGSIGTSVPADPSLDKGLGLAGNVEGYLTPRVSVRGQLEGAWFDIVGRRFTGTVNPVSLSGNLAYNWEGGRWRPYVTGGVGVYRQHSSETATAPVADTRGGINVGGGLEYFFRRRATLTGEALYHHVNSINTALTTFNDGSYWSFRAGLKTYF